MRQVLAMAVVGQQSVRLLRVRRGGLMRRHLAAVRMVATLCSGRLAGDELGSETVSLEPGRIRGDAFEFTIGGEGSVGQLLQAIVPMLLTRKACDRPVKVVLRGATFCDHGQPVLAWRDTIRPLVESAGGSMQIDIEQDAIVRRGGGRVVLQMNPAERLRPIKLLSPGTLVDRLATIHFAQLPFTVVQREVAVLKKRLGWADEEIRPHQLDDSAGPMNVITLRLGGEHVVETIATPGHVGRRAESVADLAAESATKWLGENVATTPDTFACLLPMLVLSGGTVTTSRLDERTRDLGRTLARMIGKTITFEERPGRTWGVTVSSL